jgi:hypothetical protein
LFKFTVSPDGAEPFTCEATSRDIVRWETSGKGRTMGALVENMRMIDLTDLAFIEVEKKDDSDDLGPTPAAR